MKALIIDDAELARKELQYLLKNNKDIELIGEAINATEAKAKIEVLKPDLIFLDIQMPDKTGFELLEELNYLPEVIFTTAYNEYAIKAFEHNAIDYLLKPIKEDRLSKAIIKVVEKIDQKKQKGKQFDIDSQVFVKDGDNCWFVNLSDISVLEIVGSYTRIHFLDNKPMIPRSLNYMQSRLDEKVFFRANRSQIINIKYIEKIEPWFSGTLKIFLKDGQEIEISRRQSILFKKLMSF